MTVDQEALERLGQKGAQPALLLRQIIEGIEPQQLRQEIMQRILCVVVGQPTVANETVERVMIL